MCIVQVNQVKGEQQTYGNDHGLLHKVYTGWQDLAQTNWGLAENYE